MDRHKFVRCVASRHRAFHPRNLLVDHHHLLLSWELSTLRLARYWRQDENEEVLPLAESDHVIAALELGRPGSSKPPFRFQNKNNADGNKLCNVVIPPVTSRLLVALIPILLTNLVWKSLRPTRHTRPLYPSLPMILIDQFFIREGAIQCQMATKKRQWSDIRTNRDKGTMTAF